MRAGTDVISHSSAKEDEYGLGGLEAIQPHLMKEGHTRWPFAFQGYK